MAPGEGPNEEHVHGPLLGVPLQPVCGHALQDAGSLPQLHAGLRLGATSGERACICILYVVSTYVVYVCMYTVICIKYCLTCLNL